MEEDKLNQENVPESHECKSCRLPVVEPGYLMPLCENCRTVLSKKPLPLWIKGFSIVVLMLLVYALYTFPASVLSGVYYERGLKAEKDKRFATAVREYEKVLGRYSDSTQAIAHLFIAYYQNGEIGNAFKAHDKIGGRKSNDQDLIKEVNYTLERMAKLYLPTEELEAVMKNMVAHDSSKNVELLKDYRQKYPDDVSGSYYLANAMYDLKRYDEAEEIMSDVLRKNPDFYMGNLFMAAVCREKGLYDKGLEYCRKSLEHNVEDAQAYVSMSRIALKRYKDKEGLEMAQKAFILDNQDAHVIANLSMAFHYNGMLKERDEMFNLFETKQDKNDEDLKLLTSIFNGEYKWRN